jgi:transcriptional regulator with XRE-family HTH domain
LFSVQRQFDSDLLSVPSAKSATVLRMVLGAQLRRLREARGISREAAGEAIRASHAKISRLELGRVGFKARDIADLLTLYEVADEQHRNEFLALAQRANEPGWWRSYSDVLSSWFEPYLGLEQASSVIRTYEPQFIPGLLQTEHSARAIIQQCRLHSSPEQVDRSLAVRMARQRLLTQPGAPDYWAVIDEAALRRPLDSRQSQRSQIRYLREIGQLPNVTIQVIPFRAGAHPAAGPFTILRFTEPDLPDIVYLEQLTSAVYLDKKRDTDNYRLVMDWVCAKAETPANSIKFLQGVINEI